MKLHIFNPENDLALADGSANYRAPQFAERIAYDLATLPLWFAPQGDAVLLPGEEHHDFYKKISSLFRLAMPYDMSQAALLTGAVPWGWSAQVKRRLKQLGIEEHLLPTDGRVEAIRMLSSRISSIKILECLKEMGVHTPPLPSYFTDFPSVADYICRRERCVVKAPWSGSGKGILWGIGRVEPPMENFCKGIIKRQGGVVCEEFHDIRLEFAMEFLAADGKVSFAGYSLFNTEKGGYTGNYLATDKEIEELLSQDIPVAQIWNVKSSLTTVLGRMVAEAGYEGYLGVDMMIYKSGGEVLLNPCMELNLRMNMGMVSRTFYDRYVVEGKHGRYFVEFHKEKGKALEAHIAKEQEYSLELQNGRIANGYCNLNPVTENSNYIAYAIIE